MKFIAGKAQL